MSPIETLIKLLKAAKVIPVIGAGVSLAVAGIPGWKGSIEHGLKYAEARRLDKNQIQAAREHLSLWELTQAADILKALLNAPGYPFSDWLATLFGHPTILSYDLLHSIHDLCTPMLITTNYDHLLFETKIKTKKLFDWSEYEEVSSALANKEEFIFHIHGRYEKPQTIILSSGDYTMLADQRGYKAMLQTLWTQYHFLFIGCSRDGVMDEDFSTVSKFLKEWFPSSPHQHFILLNERAIEAGGHIELLLNCNVEPISIGPDYSELSNFLHVINPNREKLLKQKVELQKEIQATIQRILVLEGGELDPNINKIKTVLKQVLPLGIYWIDSLQLFMLEKVLGEYNKQIADKKKEFVFYQNVVKSFFDVNDLQEKINFWNENRDKPSKLNTSSFISLAIMAYESLERFPKHLLEEIKHRQYYALHSYYYDGYLGQFIREYKHFQKNPRINLQDFYDGDSYFFENLTRIISSLHGLLSIDPNELFSELAPAQITPELPSTFFLFRSSNGISIRSYPKLDDIIAFLPSEAKIPISSAEVVTHGSTNIIVGSTSQRCFYWNPVRDLAAVTFYSKKPVRFLFNAQVEDSLFSYVFTREALLIFKNFAKLTEISLSEYFSSVIFISGNSTFYGIKDVSLGERGPCLFKMDSWSGEWKRF